MPRLSPVCQFLPVPVAGWSPPDRNSITSCFGPGVTYGGLVPRRDLDLLGLGLAFAGFSEADTTREDVVELFYEAQVNDWATIQPDLIYIASPSGRATMPFWSV